MCAQQKTHSSLLATQSHWNPLGAHWIAKDIRFLHIESKDSDQTARMRRLRLVHMPDGPFSHVAVLFLSVVTALGPY